MTPTINPAESASRAAASAPCLEDRRRRPAAAAGRRYPRERLIERADARGVTLGDLQLRVGNVLFHNEGRHLRAGDVAAILAQGGQDVPPRLVASALDDLAHFGITQALVAGPGLRFYDVNLAPHLHVFDAATGTLRDADASLVVSADRLGDVAM